MIWWGTVRSYVQTGPLHSSACLDGILDPQVSISYPYDPERRLWGKRGPHATRNSLGALLLLVDGLL